MNTRPLPSLSLHLLWLFWNAVIGFLLIAIQVVGGIIIGIGFLIFSMATAAYNFLCRPVKFKADLQEANQEPKS